MRWTKVVGAAAFYLLAVRSHSYAQPAADAGYPLEYVARPLALPAGAVEASGELDWVHGRAGTDYNAEQFNIQGRYSLGQAELDVGAGFLIDQDFGAAIPGTPAPEVEHFASITAGARYNVDHNLQIAGELLVGTPTRSEARLLTPRISLLSRHHLAPHTAIDVIGTAAYQTYTSDDPMLMQLDVFEIGGEVRAIAQLSPNVAAQALARLTLYDPIDDSMVPGATPGFESFLFQYFAAGAIVTASPSLDITVHGAIPNQSTVELMVGVTGRFLP
ncbi:MAG TPA: hypothetical protein VL326_19920 [Kofleriaceae bacterium]|nr:hypothetical protein [Kofleriaceae bacterium]